MGEYGRFNREDLDLLFANVTYGITALGWREFATVVVGSGEGNLSLEQAIEGMLVGVGSALRRLKDQGHLETLRIVEYDKDRFKAILKVLEKIKNNGDGSLTVRLTTRELPKRTHRKNPSKPEHLDQMKGSRITIERDRDVFRFSAIREQAVIPVREITIQSSYAEGAAELLKESRSVKDQQKYGKLSTATSCRRTFKTWSMSHRSRSWSTVRQRVPVGNSGVRAAWKGYFLRTGTAIDATIPNHLVRSAGTYCADDCRATTRAGHRRSGSGGRVAITGRAGRGARGRTNHAEHEGRTGTGYCDRATHRRE
jgi:hypothetical protein